MPKLKQLDKKQLRKLVKKQNQTILNDGVAIKSSRAKNNNLINMTINKNNQIKGLRESLAIKDEHSKDYNFLVNENAQLKQSSEKIALENNELNIKYDKLFSNGLKAISDLSNECSGQTKILDREIKRLNIIIDNYENKLNIGSK